MMNMKIDKNTELVVSVARKKGSTGVVVQNFLNKKYNVNAIYRPLAINEKYTANDIVRAIKLFDIKAAAISMPYKADFIPLLDSIDSKGAETQNINTVVCQKGKLAGYNTDYFGMRKVLEEFSMIKKAIVYGTGSVAKTAIVALRDVGCEKIKIIARNKLKENQFQTWVMNNTGISICEDISSDIIVNCTPVGMNNEKTIVSNEIIDKTSIVFDVVTNNTYFIFFI